MNVEIFRETVENRNPLFLDELHAKLYVATGLKKRSSICLLSSANLTEPALQTNVETTFALEPPYSKNEIAYIEKMRQLSEHIVRKALKRTKRT